jgi:RNA polymerase sigma-70 factor (ECF subfamily)
VNSSAAGAVGWDVFPPLLARAKEGDRWALGRLYETLQPSMLAYLRSQDADAEDIAADAWIDIARGLHRFEGGEADFRRWVFTIARRRLIDARRARRRARTQPVSPETLDRPIADAGLDALDADSAAKAIIAVLPDSQAQVVLLRVLAGFSVEETASILHKRPGAVRALQHRALRRLAKEFSAGRNAPALSSDVYG